MKKEELTEIGLTEEQADKVIIMNGKSIEGLKKTNRELTASNEDLKTRLTTAEETLTGFGDLKPEEVNQKIQSYKDRAEKAERESAERITQRDQKDWLKAQFDEYGVASPYARKQLTSEIMSKENGLPWKDGAFLGFDDYMKGAKEKDSTLYLTEEEKESQKAKEQQQDKKKFFTGPAGKKKQESETSSSGGSMRFF